MLSVKVKEEDGGSDCEFCWAEATEVKWRVRDDENGVRNLGVLIELRVLLISEVAITI